MYTKYPENKNNGAVYQRYANLPAPIRYSTITTTALTMQLAGTEYMAESNTEKSKGVGRWELPIALNPKTTNINIMYASRT